MSSEDWPEVRLGDHVDLLTGFPFKSAEFTDNSQDVPLVRGDNVVQGRFRWDGVRRWPRGDIDAYSGYLLESSDVILAMDRPWIEAGLKYAAMSPQDLPCLLVQRVSRLRGINGLSTRFLRYVIGSPAFTDHILAVQTGTAVPHISGRQIADFRFPLAPVPEQERIADVLGALDDKIELNRRMSLTLESIARAIFKSWFVDFDPVRRKMEGKMGGEVGPRAALADLFPDSLEDSPGGPIPRGWQAKPLDQVAHFLNGLALQKYPPTGSGDLPVIKGAELTRGVVSSSGRASARVPPEYVVDTGDVLFSWSGSLHCVAWSGGRGALNQHLFKVTSSTYPKWFFYHWIRWHLPAFREIAADKATTMGHIERGHLSEAVAVVPPRTVIAAADAVLSPLWDRQLICDGESRRVANVRDALLPGLVSGRTPGPTARV